MTLAIEHEVEPTLRVGGDPFDADRLLVQRELEAEFSGRLSPVDIERLTWESLSRFEDAVVRTYIPILALRTARMLAKARISREAVTT